MTQNEKNLALEFSVRWLVDLLLMAALLSLFGVSSVWARETPVSFEDNGQNQPAAQATAAPKSEKVMTQTLDSYAADNLIDFLMEEPPLTQSTAMDAPSPVLMPQTPPASNAGPTPITLEVLQGRIFESTDEVAMLVAEQCSQSGDAAAGTSSCERVYSNGHHANVLTQNANEGDELKNQTVIEEFDGDNTLLYKKTIRHRVDYNYLNDRKAKEKEFFDIIYQPAGRKTTRELMVYEYFLDTGKARSLSWTQYKQIASEPKAELMYHAMLRYSDDGSPDRGVAEQWNKGKKIETFMNWSRQSKGFATLDEETWGQWEGWIRNVSLQAYLP